MWCQPMTDLPGLYHHPDGTKTFEEPLWTPEQVQRLIEGKRRGEKNADIAQAIGRTTYAVKGKWKQVYHGPAHDRAGAEVGVS